MPEGWSERLHRQAVRRRHAGVPPSRLDVEVNSTIEQFDDDDDAIRQLLEDVYLRYHHDFRDYVISSIRRRLSAALVGLECGSILELHERVLRDPETFERLLGHLTVQVSEMFRDPPFYRAFRERIVPVLRTYPSLKIWVAGCATGEEL